MEANKHFRILLIEGNNGSHTLFFGSLDKRGFNIILVNSGKAAIEALTGKPLPQVIVLNAASLRTSGIRICSNIRMLCPSLPIVMIVDNGVKLFGFDQASVILNLPFTIQKLLNRLAVYKPAEDKLLLTSGPLVLNTHTHLLTCNGRETQLTPRLFNLLKYLMDRPGVVVDRETLFKDLWETDYTGDTRTLDVHISWLRHAIEEDQRQPKIIKTIRSKGYKLNI